jgi:hypothetical protein
MSTPASPEDILARIAAGDLAADDPEVAAAAAAEPALAQELAALRDAQALLDRAGAEERAILRRSAGASLPGFDVRAALARRAPPVPRRRPRAALSAGLLLVAAGLAWYFWPDAARPQPVVLGATVRFAAPERGADGSLRFSWQLEGRTASRHAATLTPEVSRDVLARDERLPRPTWTIDRNTSDSLPARVRLAVTAFDAAGEAVAAGDAVLDLPR